MATANSFGPFNFLKLNVCTHKKTVREISGPPELDSLRWKSCASCRATSDELAVMMILHKMSMKDDSQEKLQIIFR